MAVPRPEYPRPQFVRADWLNLNGKWEFEIDAGDSGIDKGLLERPLNLHIIVPFCPESKLSGVEHVDFMLAVWYRKIVKIPKAWAEKRVLLHVGACDYDSTVWVNGIEVGRHRGGFTSFTIDLNGVVEAGKDATILIRARDDWRPAQPKGKQALRYKNSGCVYTRTTGIWQTVWLEPVPQVYLKRTRITPDLAGGMIRLQQPLNNNRAGYQLRAKLSDPKGQVVAATVQADLDLSPRLDLAIPKGRRRVWSLEDPFLYDLTIELLDEKNKVVDRVESYAGLRSVAIDGQAIKINGKPVFQRLVLDQGYYADGVLTAPTDAALKRDITLSMQAGFNGARLHQKVFEERFLYHADKLGYLVWGEFADWGAGGYGQRDDHQRTLANYPSQWLEALERDYSHPSIVGWCPLNETWQDINDRHTDLDDATVAMYLACKAMDGTRPVVDASGYSHRVGDLDVYDSHDYEQNPEKFAANHAGFAQGKPYVNRMNVPDRPLPFWRDYRGQPYFVSEFGGIWWNPDAKPGEDSWGYGDRPKTVEEFYDRFDKLCGVLLDNPHMFGYCYTQLTDVFQEQNGIFRFNRSTKFNMKRIHAAQTKRAAIERE